jgi:hypothetical protein
VRFSPFGGCEGGVINAPGFVTSKQGCIRSRAVGFGPFIYYNHKTSFTLYEKRNSTELSKYVWQLKRGGIEFHIKWQTLKRAKSYRVYLKVEGRESRVKVERRE